MKETEPYSINKEELIRTKTLLHRIPEMHVVERDIVHATENRPTIFGGVITVIGVAASVMIGVMLWPSETQESDLNTDSLLEDLYDLGYVEMSDFYSYIEPDSLGFVTIKSDSTIWSNYSGYLNNYLNEI